MADTFRRSASPRPSPGTFRPKGQHIELGIAEMNLFILLSALGLSHSLFGERLLPIGTLYDPFIARGLDALNYACYQDARFIAGGDALRRDARAGGRRAPVDRHAADRPGAGRACRLRAGLRRRARRDPALRLRLHAARRRRRRDAEPSETTGCATRPAARSICACRRAPLDQPQRGHDAGTRRRHRRRRLLAAPARPERRRSSSPIPAPSRRRRSRRSA